MADSDTDSSSLKAVYEEQQREEDEARKVTGPKVNDKAATPLPDEIEKMD